MKIVALVFVALLAVGVVVVPEPSSPSSNPAATPAPAPYAVCPLGESARRETAISFVGGSEGDISASVFSAGEVTSEVSLSMPADGALAVEVSDLTGLARAPVLVGLAATGARAVSVMSGAGVAASTCDAGSSDTVVLVGGSTAEGETYTLVLANPFAGTATVSLSVASEVGTESNPDLDQVVVPPRSAVTVDLSGQLPSRQLMSVAVTPQEGRVVTGAIQEGDGDVAAAAGLLPGSDWYIPVPDLEGVNRSLVISAPGSSEVAFQLDVYDSEGLVEAAYEDTVPARGQVAIAAGELLDGAGVVRVVAAGPLAAGLRLSGDNARAFVPGVAEPSTSWRLPGAGRLGSTQVHIFNPGEVDVAARLLSGNGDPLEELDVPAGTWTTVPVSERPNGVILEGDGDLVVTWTTATEGGLAGDAAQPGG